MGPHSEGAESLQCPWNRPLRSTSDAPEARGRGTPTTCTAPSGCTGFPSNSGYTAPSECTGGTQGMPHARPPCGTMPASRVGRCSSTSASAGGGVSLQTSGGRSTTTLAAGGAPWLLLWASLLLLVVTTSCPRGQAVEVGGRGRGQVGDLQHRGKTRQATEVDHGIRTSAAKLGHGVQLLHTTGLQEGGARGTGEEERPKSLWYTAGRPFAAADHPLLVHHVPAALAKFGSPVVGESRLAFDCAEGVLPRVSMRELRHNADCPSVACPKSAPCRGTAGNSTVEFAMCHAPDRRGPWDLNTILLLRNVYLNNEGVIYNESHVFDLGDCTLGPPDDPWPWRSHRVGTRVVHLERAFSLVHRWGKNFYHNLVEVLPMFFALAAYLRQDPGIPILMRRNFYEVYVRVGKHIVGIDESKLNVVFPISHKVQIFVRELIQPQFGLCMEPDLAALQHLRQHFFLRPQGLPFLRSSLQPRMALPVPDAEMESLPQDWKVVVYLRPKGGSRSLVAEEQVVAQLEKAFPHRVIVLRSDLHITSAIHLFRQTRLMVSVHGASLTNMLFMPKGAFIVEIRLSDYNLPLYEKMARGCNMQYLSVLGKGSKGSPVTVNISDVERALGSINRSMDEQQSRTPQLLTKELKV